MGYRGKLEERARARELRAEAWTLQEIADELGVSKSSVSLWVRDVEFVAKPRKRVAAQRTTVHPARRAKLCAWLRTFFGVDESRLRVVLYLHEGLDLDAANAYWEAVTAIPCAQFSKPYRAVPDGGIRSSKHPYGCPSVSYSCSRTHRAIMGLVHALVAPGALAGFAAGQLSMDVGRNGNGCR